MAHITTIERLARQEGRQEGRQESWREGWREGWQDGVPHLLEARFGETPEAIRAQVRGVAAPAELKAMLLKAARVGSLAEFAGGPEQCAGSGCGFGTVTDQKGLNG
ncbi:MAG: hypothetical protein NTX27_04570 [Verrucomicrobia bacterium]|nr:hypothetical protein [Verrucomicrobiota bacterium]